jgi:hypothetical protein
MLSSSLVQARQIAESSTSMNEHHTPRQQEGIYLGAGQWAESENQALVAAGFALMNEEYNLWSKDGVLFGRKAALQAAGQALHPSSAKDKDVFNEEA